MSHEHEHSEPHVHDEHSHGESCGCGHGHSHAHNHHSHEQAEPVHDQHTDEESCNCGHGHCQEEKHHSHEQGEPEHGEHRHDESCSCGHSHSHEEHGPESAKAAPIPDTKAEKRTYILENLGCANCAAKMEKRIGELPGVEYAGITFTTKQLRIAASHQEELLPRIREICASIESEVTVIPMPKREKKDAEHAHGNKEGRKDLICIAAGIIFFILGFVFEKNYTLVSNIMFVLAYIALGTEIVWTAVKNIFKGNIFDENFLMSIATIGAFAIGQFEEAVGVMLFYRIGEWFEHRAVSKSRSQIMDALDLRPENVNLVKDGNITVIPAEDAVAGDILLVRPGDRIPLDGTVTEGESRIDTSPVTGEPVPVRVLPGSQVISGCLNTSGVLKLRADKVLEESMVSRILDSVENAAASKPQIDRFITKFARVYTPIVVLLALGTAILPSLITGDWNHWIYTALTFLVISCPCALVLSVPLAFFSGIGAGSKQGILFKGGASIEALKNIKAVVMDKTGTITKGNFVLQEALPSSGYTAMFSSEKEARDSLLSLAAACESASTHPIATSILEAVSARGLSAETPSAIEEISGCGIRARLLQGTVLCGNQKLMSKNHVRIQDSENTGYGTEVFLALDGTYIGRLVIADTLKEDAAPAIHALNRQNIVTAMLTGDAYESAAAVAAQTGIIEVHAKLLPQDKLEELKKIRENHGAVMFVGDGINDAPVLAGADVGAAMGSGADAAIEAADVVFMTSSMTAVPESIRIAKTTGNIAIQNVVFALVIKVLVMILGLAGFASMWFAVFADSGVAMLCVLNSIRILYRRQK